MNYYDILKVTETASQAEIKNSYKKLVKKYHPDLYVGDKNFAEKTIKEINEAYNILSNPETKAEYDSYLNTLKEPTTPPISENQTYSNNDVKSETTDNENPTNFSKIIWDKIFNLDIKYQLQIFIITLIIILALILNNLLQVQHYLKNPHNNSEKSNNTTNTGFINNEFEPPKTPYYDNFNFNSLDSIFSDFLEQHEEDFSSNIIYNNYIF